jgi:pyruvate dehydrogenase E2 component (dihydrolipoamide acetyltransferase)
VATEVLIPKLGMTMTEGTVAEWRVANGAVVAAGQSIYRLETEKIEFEVEAESGGIVRHLVPAGTKLEPGAVVAYILAPGEAMPAGAPVIAAAVASAAAVSVPAVSVRAVLDGGRIPSSPIARRLAKESGIALASIAGSGPGGRITETDVLLARSAPRAPGRQPAPGPAREVLASPLARKLAEQLRVDLARVRGTGPGGRVTQEDVETASSMPAAAAPAATGDGRHRPGDRIPIRAMRKVIAERMHASLQQMAQLTMGMEVAMDDAVKLRSQLIDEWAADAVRPSFTDLVIKAVAKALRGHPLLNARVGETEIELLEDVHVGMAVALDAGLVVPVIRDAVTLPLREIAVESTRLALAARNGTLGLDEMAGGTFSVTALGMAGVDFFTPIINPPNVAILGVGRIHDAVAWEGDRPVRRQQMTLSLTVDHRAVDGAPAAAFLATVRDLLESPYRLLV